MTMKQQQQLNLPRWVRQLFDLNIQPQSGDSYYFSAAHFGAGANSGGSDEGTVSADGGTAGAATHGVAGDAATEHYETIPVQSRRVALRHALP